MQPALHQAARAEPGYVDCRQLMSTTVAVPGSILTHFVPGYIMFGYTMCGDIMSSYFSFVKEFLTLMKKVPKSPMGIDELEELERRRMGDFEGMQHRMEELQGRRGVLHRRPAPAGPPARHLRPPGRPRARHPRPQTRHL